MQQMNANAGFGDRDMMTDALSSQKFITEIYNTYANEAAAENIKDEFMSILAEEHQIQHELFTEMQKRGWYQMENAEQQKIDQAKQKFQNLGC